MNKFAALKKLMLCVAALLLLQSCQSLKSENQKTQSNPAPKEINYQKVFAAAIKVSGNRLPYKIQDRLSKDGSVVYAAEFPTKKKTSFQTLEMTLLKSDTCVADTPSQELKLKSRGVGPSGASFDISFCAGSQFIKLADFNRLSMSDHPHGIGLIALAKNIQAEISKSF